MTRRPQRRVSSMRAMRTALLGPAIGGCGWNTPQSTLIAASDFAREIHGLYALITWAAVGIAAVVFGVLGYVLLRFRERPGAPTPPQTHGGAWLEIAWTIAPALVLLVIAVPTIQVTFRTQSETIPRGALEATVRAYQWWWEFEYPSLGVVTANELHVPAGRPVVLRLEGGDVIHSFWIPKLGGKRDVIPGRVNRLSFTPETPGEYPGQCAEFCGVSHANMRKRVVVEAPEAFERWVAGQRAPAVEPTGLATEGKTVFARSACVGCHRIAGISEAKLGPDLSHFGSRRTFAAGMLPVTPENVGTWIEDPGAVKPGAKMPALLLTKDETRALAAYLVSLK